MRERLKELEDLGYNIVVFLEDSLVKFPLAREVLKKAKELGLPVYYSSSMYDLVKTRKLYVLRYGELSSFVENSIKRKGGQVVSGFL